MQKCKIAESMRRVNIISAKTRPDGTVGPLGLPGNAFGGPKFKRYTPRIYPGSRPLDSCGRPKEFAPSKLLSTFLRKMINSSKVMRNVNANCYWAPERR